MSTSSEAVLNSWTESGPEYNGSGTATKRTKILNKKRWNWQVDKCCNIVLFISKSRGSFEVRSMLDSLTTLDQGVSCFTEAVAWHQKPTESRGGGG
jgi:hypothetical protein